MEQQRVVYRNAIAKRNPRAFDANAPRKGRISHTEPARDPFRPQHALPPSHISLTPEECRREQQRIEAALKRDPSRRSELEIAIIPSWAYRLAARVHAGHFDLELLKLPPHLALAIRRAADWCPTEAGRSSCIAVGIALAWLSLRAPQRCGRATTVAGTFQGQLCGLTRRKDGAPYSKSWLAHGTHARPAENGHEGPRGGTWGDPEQGEVGALRLLELAGALKVWVPNPVGLPVWMLGTNGYPCACYRILLGDEPELAEPPERPPRVRPPGPARTLWERLEDLFDDAAKVARLDSPEPALLSASEGPCEA